MQRAPQRGSIMHTLRRSTHAPSPLLCSATPAVAGYLSDRVQQCAASPFLKEVVKQAANAPLGCEPIAM